MRREGGKLRGEEPSGKPAPPFTWKGELTCLQEKKKKGEGRTQITSSLRGSSSKKGKRKPPSERGKGNMRLPARKKRMACS